MSESNIWKERPHSLLGSKESCNQTDEEKKKKNNNKEGKKKKKASEHCLTMVVNVLSKI